MPDNEKKPTPDKDGGDTITDLSAMISSAKKKMEQDTKDTSAEAAADAADKISDKFNDKPDISFAAAENGSVSKPAPKPAAKAPAAKQDKPAPIKKETQAAKPAVQSKAADTAKKTTSIADKAAAAAEKAAAPDNKTAKAAAPAQPKPAAAQPARPGQPPKRHAPPPRRRPPQQGATGQPNGRPAAKDGKTAQQKGKPPAQGARPQSGKPGASKPAAGGKRPQQGGKPAPEKQLKKPADNKKIPAGRPDTEPTENAGDNTAVGGRRFTKKQKNIIIGLVAGLLLLLVLIVAAFCYYAGLFDRTKPDSSKAEPPTYSDVDFSRPDTMDTVTADQKLQELREKAEIISNKDVMNILLIGEDIRDTANEEAGNTDVMMIISINKKDKTITETSIMRDCYVYFPSQGYSNRINAAYWHGGIDLTQTTIEDYLGLKIDRYVLVNFRVFIDIVDTLGGLDLTVTDEEANGYPGADPNGDNTRGMQNPLDEQNKYLGNKKGTDYIEKGGDLHLNGNQALAYARLRHVGNSDYERTARQRKVIKEMIKKSKKLSIIQMDKLAKKIFPQIKTDLTEGEMAGLLIELLEYRNYKVQEFRVPMDDTYTNEVINGMDVLNVDFYTNSEMLKKKVYGSIAIDEEGNETKNTIE